MIPPTTELASGIDIPMLGIGMDQVRDFKQGYDALIYAFSIGYRSVDTAYSYGNEEAVGRAVRDCGIPRSEIFITTKLTMYDQGYDSALRAFDKSLKNLGLEYMDSFLIHWPGKYYFTDTWKAFIRLFEEKMIRAIGVCNFNIHHLEKLREKTGVMPAINQVEWHPYFQQPQIAKYCKQHNILLEAWSPLMCGGEVLEDKHIVAISQEIGKSSAQVILRWHLQQGRRIFPKSVTPSRISENLDIFDFDLTPTQIEVIDSMGVSDLRIGPDPDIFFLV